MLIIIGLPDLNNIRQKSIKIQEFCPEVSLVRIPSEAALPVLSSASLFLIASSGSTDRFSLLADEEMGIFFLGGPFVAGF